MCFIHVFGTSDEQEENFKKVNAYSFIHTNTLKCLARVMGKRTHIFTYIHIFGAGDGKEEVMGKKTHTFAFIRIHSHTFIYMVQVKGKKTHTFIHPHYIHIHSYVWCG